MKFKSIKSRITYLMALGIAIITILTTLLFVNIQRNRLLDKQQLMLEVNLEVAENSMHLPMWNIDKQSALSIADALMYRNNLIEVKLVDEWNNEFIHVSKDNFDSLVEGSISGSQDIIYQDKYLGTIHLTISSNEISAQIRDLIGQNIIVLVTQLALGVLLIRLIIKRSLTPLSDIESLADQISEGNYNVDIKETGDFEFASLTKALKIMQLSLSEKENRINANLKQLTITNDNLTDANKEIEELYGKVLNVNNKLEQALLQNKSNYNETITALVQAIDAKDYYTGGHSKRVAEFSELIGSHLGLKNEKLEQLRLAGLLHDIGKIGIDSSILNKKGKLLTEEFNIIKKHPAIGFEILHNISQLNSIAEMIYKHHERPDGFGYPNNLKLEDISLEAGIIHVADAYDAMTSSRVYRQVPLTREQVIHEIEKGMGKQFMIEPAQALLDYLQKN